MSDYKDDDFVYIDPSKKAVAGKVEWDKSGHPKKKEIPFDPTPAKEGAEGEKRPRKPRNKQYYIWGSYKSAKKMYNIEGKWKQEDNNKTLEEVMKLALKQAFWN